MSRSLPGNSRSSANTLVMPGRCVRAPGYARVVRTAGSLSPRPRCSPSTRGWSTIARSYMAGCDRAPRVRGVVPCRYARRGWQGAPRVRGGGPRTRPRAGTGGVLPAYAGVVPGTQAVCLAGTRSAPRVRGGGPKIVPANGDPMVCSPRTRGWSTRHAGGSVRRACAPAYAGVVPPGCGRPCRSGAPPRQCGSALWIRYAERLADAGSVASVGSKEDPTPMLCAESFNGLFKAELIRRCGPWKNVDQVGLATPCCG